MPSKGIVIVMFDAPDSEEFVSWVHGPHMEIVESTPGVTKVRRYRISNGPIDGRNYIAVMESDDLEATLEWRNSAAGQLSQREADERGISNRFSLVGHEIYSSE